ncbi:hypothetical protein [Pantoea sp. PGP6]
MTIDANIVNAIVTISSLGKTVSDHAGNIIRKGESLRVHLLAVQPGWDKGSVVPETLLVGTTFFTGFSTSAYSRAVKVLLPDGYQLIALPVDSEGCAISWESLPVHIEAIESGNEPFKISGEGKVYINDALVKPGTTTYAASVRIHVDTKKVASTADKIRAIVSKYLYGQASEYEDELVAELKSFIEKENDYNRLATLISEQVRQRIKAESQPGGLLHKR